MTRFVLDACALITYFKRSEAGHTYALDFLKSHSTECLIHAMNMAEVYYRTYQVGGLSRADQILRQTKAMGVVITESMPESLWTDAAWAKVTYGLGFMDAVAFAQARKDNAKLVTRDRNAFEGIKKAFPERVMLF